MSTYDRATKTDDEAVELYGWNAEISAAFLVPLHIAEVTVRNAASDGLEAVYGHRWPWSTVFEQSLPNPQRGYNQRRDLLSARVGQGTTGKVIPEVKFVFWQKLFTQRHDVRLWDAQILQLFPNAPQTSAAAVRSRVYTDLERIRNLRNRIAHHEPVFTRNLSDDLAMVLELVRFRSSETAMWLAAREDVTRLLSERP